MSGKIVPLKFYLFGLCFVAAWLGSLLQDIVAYSSQPPNFDGRVWLLDIDAEGVVFSWLSSLGLFLCSLLLFQTASDRFRSSVREALPWAILGLIFFALSGDETVSMHEKLTGPMRRALDAKGHLYFAWIVVAGPIVAIVGLCFYPFLRSLPGRIAGLMILSGVLYVGGAIGVEMIGGNLAYESGYETLTYRVIAHVEEGLEAAGILTFAATLIIHHSEAKSSQARARRGSHQPA